MGWRRMRLRRFDGAIYLDRWGWECRWGGVFLHRMDAPDPGLDLHDHPWWFMSWVLAGGYVEEREEVRLACLVAQASRGGRPRGNVVERRRWSVKAMRRDECHRIVRLTSRRCWTLVFHGPVRGRWGFYLPTRWVSEEEYDATVRADRRDLWNEGPDSGRVV